MKHDATLEEMWRIKEELSTAHDTWEEYLADIYSYQEQERKRGVKFVSFSSDHPGIPEFDSALSVAEAPAEYGSAVKPTAPGDPASKSP